MSVFAKASAKRSARAAWTGLAIAGVSALVLTACSTGGTPSAETEEPAADAGDALPIAEGERDLALKFGTILPQSGALAFLGPPEEAGVQLGADDVNAVADSGLSVEIVFRDSGDTTTDIATDLGHRPPRAGCLGDHRCGIVRRVEDRHRPDRRRRRHPVLAGQHVGRLHQYDDNGLYWRTAPSDVLQGEVLGNLIAEDGHATLGMIVLNDSYGTGLAQSSPRTPSRRPVARSSPRRSSTTGDSSFDAQICEVTGGQPRRDRADHVRPGEDHHAGSGRSGYPGDQLYFVDGNLSDYSADFAPGLVAGSKGTLPGLDTGTLGDFTDRLLEVDPALDRLQLRG